MRKLIETYQENLIECDFCDYVIPSLTKDINEPIIQYLDKPCPKCGNNLLTTKDYIESDQTVRLINFINKWFSWLTIFTKNKKETIVEVKVHNGIKIS